MSKQEVENSERCIELSSVFYAPIAMLLLMSASVLAEETKTIDAKQMHQQVQQKLNSKIDAKVDRKLSYKVEAGLQLELYVDSELDRFSKRVN